MKAATSARALAMAAVALVPLVVLPPPWFALDSPFLLVDGAMMPKVALGRILVALAFVAWAIALTRGELELRRWRFDWLALVLLGWGVVATAFAPDWRTSLGGDTFQRMGLADGAAALALWWLLVQLIDTRARFVQLARVISVTGAAISAVALMQVLGVDPLRESQAWADRASSTLGNPGLLAVYAIGPFMLSLGLFLTETDRRWRIAAGVAAALCAGSVAASFARAGWIGAIVALGVFAVVVGVRRLAVPALGAAGVVGLAALGGLRSGSADASAVARVTGEGSAGLLGERPAIWEAAVDSVAQRPLVGWGPDSFRQAYWRFTDLPYTSTDGTALQAIDAHSSVLGAAAALGVPGALIALAFVATTLVSTRSVLNRSLAGRNQGPLIVACWAAVMGMCVASLASISGYAVLVTCLAIMALLVAPSAKVQSAPAWGKVMAWAGAATMVVGALLGVAALRATHLDALALASTDPGRSLELASSAANADPLGVVYLRHVADRASYIADSTDSAQADAYFAQAEAALETALLRSPNDQLMHLSLVRLHNVRAASGRTSRGVKVAERALAIGKTPELLAEYGMALKFEGDIEGCREALGDAVQLDPRYIQARVWLAKALVDSGAAEDARDQCTEIAAIDPGNEDAAAILRRLSGGDASP